MGLVGRRDRPTTITGNGKPEAVIVSVEDYRYLLWPGMEAERGRVLTPWPAENAGK